MMMTDDGCIAIMAALADNVGLVKVLLRHRESNVTGLWYHKMEGVVSGD